MSSSPLDDKYAKFRRERRRTCALTAMGTSVVLLVVTMVFSGSSSEPHLESESTSQILSATSGNVLQQLMDSQPLACPEAEEPGRVWLHVKPQDSEFWKRYRSKRVSPVEHVLQRESTGAPFRVHNVSFDVSDLRRPVYQWHGNKAFLQSVRKGDLRNSLQFENFKPFDSALKDAPLKQPELYFLSDDLGETEYRASLVTARNAVVKEQLWACGERLINFDCCGFPARKN